MAVVASSLPWGGDRRISTRHASQKRAGGRQGKEYDDQETDCGADGADPVGGTGERVASGQAAAAPWDNDGGPVTNAVNITVWTRGDNYRAPRVYITTAYGRYVKDARNVGYPKRRPGRTGFSYVAYNVPQGVALKVRVASPYHFLGGERLFFQNFHFTKHQERSVGLIQQGLGSFTE